MLVPPLALRCALPPFSIWSSTRHQRRRSPQQTQRGRRLPEMPCKAASLLSLHSSALDTYYRVTPTVERAGAYRLVGVRYAAPGAIKLDRHHREGVRRASIYSVRVLLEGTKAGRHYFFKDTLTSLKCVRPPGHSSTALGGYAVTFRTVPPLGTERERQERDEGMNTRHPIGIPLYP